MNVDDAMKKFEKTHPHMGGHCAEAFRAGFVDGLEEGRQRKQLINVLNEMCPLPYTEDEAEDR